MRIIHTVTWTPSEIESYRQLAFLNVLEGMRELLTAMRDELHVDVAEENVVSDTVAPAPVAGHKYLQCAGLPSLAPPTRSSECGIQSEGG